MQIRLQKVPRRLLLYNRQPRIRQPTPAQPPQTSVKPGPAVPIRAVVLGEATPALVLAAEGKYDFADEGGGMAEGWGFQDGVFGVDVGADVGGVAGGGAGEDPAGGVGEDL